MTEILPSLSDRKRIHILGVPVDVLTTQNCMDRIAQFVASDTPHLIVTADACGMVQAQSDPELMALYKNADLVTADSAGVLWAAKRQGEPLPDKVSGVDIVENACRTSAETGWRIYFLGAGPGVAQEAADKLMLRYPGCNIVGVRDGYFPADKDAEIAAEVALTKPDILFVGMGIPRQEKFILGTQNIIGAKTALGCGGSFDVFSGRIQRAPKLFINLRIEWMWRLMQDRKKISKVRMLPTFVRYVLQGKGT